MHTTKGLQLTGSAQLDEELSLLAVVEPSEAPFLSCYLDTRAGLANGMADLQRKAAVIRDRLQGVVRMDFDSALEIALHELQQRWKPGVAGMAVFARGIAGGRYLSCLCFATPFDNRVIWYRVPEILPLIVLRQREPATRVLLARGDKLELLDFELGVCQERAWAQVPLLARTADPESACGSIEHVDTGDNSLQVMRRAVASGDRPLLVAGDTAVLRALADWLPARARARLVGSIALSVRLQGDAAREAVRQQITAMRADEAAQVVARLVRRMRSHGNAAAGQRAVFDALRDGRVEVLLVADCRREDCTVLDEAACAQADYWDAQIELPRLACERDIRVIISNADTLRYLGGIGCLLHRPGGQGDLLPLRNGRRIDLVA